MAPFCIATPLKTRCFCAQYHFVHLGGVRYDGFVVASTDRERHQPICIKGWQGIGQWKARRGYKPSCYKRSF